MEVEWHALCEIETLYFYSCTDEKKKNILEFVLIEINIMQRTKGRWLIYFKMKMPIQRGMY